LLITGVIRGTRPGSSFGGRPRREAPRTLAPRRHLFQVIYAERAVTANVDARLDVWMGMSHGFAGSVGKLKAAAQALDAIGTFLVEKL
jgi:acetyl esterase/lipase